MYKWQKSVCDNFYTTIIMLVLPKAKLSCLLEHGSMPYELLHFCLQK